MLKRMGKLVTLIILGVSSLVVGNLNAFATGIDPYLSVYNANISSVEASVNTYGDGSSVYYSIPSGKVERWIRSNDKGFLVALRFAASPSPKVKVYYSPSRAHYTSRVYSLFTEAGKEKKDISIGENRYQMDNGQYISAPNNSLYGISDKIKVKNIGNSTKVAISTWNGGDSSYYNLSRGETETWSRSNDSRGYLMNVNGAKYFIRSGETAIVNGTKVYINDKLAKRCDLLDI